MMQPHIPPQIPTLRELKGLLHRSGIRARHLAVPAVLALGASIAEGLTLSLLIPTLDAVLYGRRIANLALSCGVTACPPTIGNWLAQQSLTTFILLIFLAAATKTSLAYLSSLAVATHMQRFASRLRTSICTRYLSCGKQFFDRASTGHLQQIITTYVALVSRGLSAINSALYAVSTLVVYLLIMLFISAKLTVLVLVGFPVLGISLRWLIRRIAHTSNVHAETYNLLGKTISNTLHGMTVIQSSNMEEAERARFEHVSNQAAAFELSIERKTLLIAPIQELILLGILLCIVALMGLSVASGTPGLISSYAVYLLILRRSVALVGVFNSIASSLASISGPMAEIRNVLSPEGKFQIPDGTKSCAGLRSAIEIRNLTFGYDDSHPVLDDISFTIPKGQVTALVGASGSGKSTLVHLLMRFYDIPAGTITIDGEDLRSFTVATWRRHLSLVSQDTFLFNATLRENLTYGIERDLTAKSIEEAVERARLGAFVAGLPLGLETPVGDRGVRLSGGERQRVCIARTILKGAEILLLDEPTSALDSTTERLIQDALDDLIGEKTVLVVAHRLSTVRRADQIVVLEAGRIAESGTFDSLCSSGGRFSQYWNEQLS